MGTAASAGVWNRPPSLSSMWYHKKYHNAPGGVEEYKLWYETTYIPSLLEKRRRGYQNHLKKCSLRNSRPDVKAKMRDYMRAKMREKRKDPQFVAKEKEVTRRYYYSEKGKRRREIYSKKPEVIARVKAREEKNKLRRRELSRINSKTEKFRSRVNKYRQHKISEDPSFRIRLNLSRSLLTSLRRRHAGSQKCESVTRIVGCSMDQLVQHLETKFQPGMSWNNYGMFGWHIDHIRPCTSFNLADPEQQKLCFHYTNLQPLWAKDNLSKSGKYQVK